MEKQKTLSLEVDHDDFEKNKPEVKRIVNTFVTAGALVKEEIIKKTWIIPKVLAS